MLCHCYDLLCDGHIQSGPQSECIQWKRLITRYERLDWLIDHLEARKQQEVDPSKEKKTCGDRGMSSAFWNIFFFAL